MWRITLVSHALLCKRSQLHPYSHRFCRVVWSCMITKIFDRIVQAYCANLLAWAHDALKLSWAITCSYSIWNTHKLCASYEFNLSRKNVWISCAQQNSYSISHRLDTVTTWWLDSNSVVGTVTVGSTVTTLTFAAQSPCCLQLSTVTTLSMSSHHVVTVYCVGDCNSYHVDDWWTGSFAV